MLFNFSKYREKEVRRKDKRRERKGKESRRR